MKFGSRMDVLVPPHVDLTLEEGQHVRAGETVIGWLPAAASEEAGDAAAAHSADASTTP